MLSIEDTDKGSECGSLNASPISKSLRDNKIKNTRLSMKVTLFGTPRSEKREFSDSPGENIKKYCGSWSTTNHYTKDHQVGWDRDEPHFRIEKSNDRKPTEETLTPNMEDEHKKISVGLYNDKPNEAYYGNIVSLDSISCSQGSQGSLPDEISMKTSQNRKLRLDTNPAKDHTSPLYPEEDEEGIASRTEEDGNLAESPGQYIPPIFSKGIESEAEELREELQIEDGQNIYLIRGDFFSYYIEEETLGEGMSGIVKKCTKVGTEETFAVKMVRYRGDTELLYLIVKEFKNHKNLNHKNIIKVYELYIDYVTKRIYTVMELAECKEMFETIQDLGNYSEAVASEIFKQILSGINYLHLSGVCHRDLKPNNILVSNDAKIVKITDFNVSKFTEKEKKSKYSGLSTQNYKMWTHTGTIAFTAPEVFTDSEYTEAVDMWSAGVVLYTMLCGYQPFQGDNIQELIELIKEGKYEFHSDPWDNISSQAKELIKRLIDVNVKTRFSPFQALTHSWIANQGKVSNKCISGVIENLWSYLNKNSKQDGKQTSSKASINADSKGSFSELPTPKLYDGANKFKSTPPKKQLLGAFLSPMRNKLTSNEEKRFFYQQGINYSDELGLEKSLSFGIVEGQANFFKLSQIQKEEMRKDDFQIFKELKNAKAIPDLSKVCETIGEDNNEDLAENDNKEEEEPISCVRDSDDSF